MKPIHTLLVAATLLYGTPLVAGLPIDETHDVDSDAIIDIEITNGRVTITGWDNDQFRISGELAETVESYDLRVVNGGIRFDENIDRPARWSCWGRNCGNDRDSQSIVDIQVPRNSVLQFEGINVDITVDSLTGNTAVEIINGEIRAADLRGVVDLETVNGSIDTSGLEGRVTLETVNGSIDDRNSSGTRVSFNAINGSIRSNTRSPRVHAENVNGDMDLELGSIDELELSTVGGRLEILADMNERAQIDISTVGGRVDLALPADTSARFNVKTAVGGRIDNRLSSDEPQRENRFVNSSELRFSLGSGDGDVSISTVHGNITLRER